MTARVKALTIVLIAAINISAQVTVESEVTTSDVNLFDTQVPLPYNMTAAMGMSLVLPGAGHYYMDKHTRAWTYFSIDIASIFGAIAFSVLSNRHEQDARSFATTVAGIERAPGGSAYWRHVGQFMDAAEYNEAVELSRGNSANLYTNPESWWHWGNEEQQEMYNDMRQKARDMRVVSSFFLGALAVNRIVSVVDIRVFQKRAMSRSVRLSSMPTPDLNGAALMLHADF